jgi:hypothetical protein
MLYNIIQKMKLLFGLFLSASAFKIDAVPQNNHLVGSDGNAINTSLKKHAKVQMLAQTSASSLREVYHNQTLSLKSVNSGDSIYSSDIWVGNPPQKLRAMFDTGSANTWILSSKVKFNNNNHFSYNESKSSSAKFSDQKATIHFGTGSLEGHFMTDDIRLGFAGSSDRDGPGSILVKNYKFGLVETQKDIFNIFGFDAIIGLAYSKIAQKNVVPLFDQIMSQNLLQHNLFAFYMTSLEDQKKGFNSEFALGYYDKSKFKGDLNWYPIVKQDMFEIEFDDILIGGKSYGMCKQPGQKCLLALDSGTTYMSVPNFAQQIMVKNGIPVGGNS